MLTPLKLSAAILAETVRQEAGGKVSLLGVYADGQILLAPGTPLPARLPLAFYFLFVEGEGSYDARFRIVAPSKNELITVDLGKQEKRRDQPMTIMVGMPLFQLSELGTYAAIVTVGDNEYVRAVSLAYGPASLIPPSG